MPRFESALNRLTPVYAGADAGHYTLPDEVVQARAAFESILEANRASRVVSAPLDPAQIEQRAVEAIFDAAEAGKPIFDSRKPPQWTADLLAARQQQEQRAAEARVLSEAADRAGSHLTSAVIDMADITITEHLRPAFEETVETVLALAPRAMPLPWNQPEEVIRMTDKARQTWDAMTKAHVRYQALRNAQDTLWRLLEEPDRGLWRFMEMRSMAAVWPAAGSWQEQAPPWPKEGRARLLWLVARRDDAGLWMPTPDQARLAMAAQRKQLNARVAGVPISSTGGGLQIIRG